VLVCTKIAVFWNVMPCSLIDRHQQFGRTCCLSAVKMEVPDPSETFGTYPLNIYVYILISVFWKANWITVLEPLKRKIRCDFVQLDG
jgi:hypothetical protein